MEQLQRLKAAKMHIISTGLAQCFLNHLVFDHFLNENGF